MKKKLKAVGWAVIQNIVPEISRKMIRDNESYCIYTSFKTAKENLGWGQAIRKVKIVEL